MVAKRAAVRFFAGTSQGASQFTGSRECGAEGVFTEPEITPGQRRRGQVNNRESPAYFRSRFNFAQALFGGGKPGIRFWRLRKGGGRRDTLETRRPHARNLLFGQGAERRGLKTGLEMDRAFFFSPVAFGKSSLSWDRFVVAACSSLCGPRAVATGESLVVLKPIPEKVLPPKPGGTYHW